MTFTDYDLRSLKRETDDIFVYKIRQIHIKALIARLEAAEQWCAYCWSVACNEGTYSEEEVSQLERWRKAAGK
jgi:hypothetical protein